MADMYDIGDSRYRLHIGQGTFNLEAFGFSDFGAFCDRAQQLALGLGFTGPALKGMTPSNPAEEGERHQPRGHEPPTSKFQGNDDTDQGLQIKDTDEESIHVKEDETQGVQINEDKGLQMKDTEGDEHFQIKDDQHERFHFQQDTHDEGNDFHTKGSQIKEGDDNECDQMKHDTGLLTMPAQTLEACNDVKNVRQTTPTSDGQQACIEHEQANDVFIQQCPGCVNHLGTAALTCNHFENAGQTATTSDGQQACMEHERANDVSIQQCPGCVNHLGGHMFNKTTPFELPRPPEAAQHVGSWCDAQASDPSQLPRPPEHEVDMEDGCVDGDEVHQQHVTCAIDSCKAAGGDIQIQTTASDVDKNGTNHAEFDKKYAYPVNGLRNVAGHTLPFDIDSITSSEQLQHLFQSKEISVHQYTQCLFQLKRRLRTGADKAYYR